MYILDKLSVGCSLAAVVFSIIDIFDISRDEFDHDTKLTNQILLDERIHKYFEHRPLESFSRRPKMSIPKSIINKSGYTGTAFKVGEDLWITARHVIHHCKKAYVKPNLTSTEDDYILIDNTFLHPRSDMAAFRYSNLAKPFNVPTLLDSEYKKLLGKSAFVIGYPNGLQGNLYVNFLEKARLESRDYEIIEPVLVWNIKHKRPHTLTSVGGISGGPLINKDSKVIGSLIAEQIRRGTVITADLNSINWLIKAMDSEASPIYNNENLSMLNIDQVAKEFLEEGNVVKLICNT